MGQQRTILVFGGTGQTGQHFVSLALGGGHRVRALARDPAKFTFTDDGLEVHEGAIGDVVDLDRLLRGVDFVVSMLGDASMQKRGHINAAFVRELVPAMRRQGVARFLYQAGGLSRPPGERLPPVQWAIRNTVARQFIGQHEDNEAVMGFLRQEAADIEWIVHRAAIGSNGASKGALARSRRRLSVATFVDCAAYNLRTVMDDTAVHTCDLSRYEKS
jgi:putative NADH-flavin reductase